MPSHQPSASRSDVTRRLRALLHTMPLATLRRGESSRLPAHQHYDFLVLALEAFDLIIEHTNLEREADVGEISQALRPLLSAMDQEVGQPVDPARHEAVAADLLDFLCGGSGRRPFEESYADWNGGPATRQRTAEFRLLRESFAPGDRIVLRLSPEAVNLFLNALDLEIEDAQTATKAVIQSQLARGRFRDAAASAEQARLQSILYREKIDAKLTATRQDLRQVDWENEMPTLLKDALAHLGSQLSTESAILETVRQQLEDLASESPEAGHVVMIADQMENCRLRHLDLQQRLIGVRQVFLDEQDRQDFAPPPAVGRIDPLGGLLATLLRAGQDATRRVLDPQWPALIGPRLPRVFSVANLLHWHLQLPRRETTYLSNLLIPERDLEQMAGELPYFTEEIWRRAKIYLQGTVPGELLSTLLARAHAARETVAVLELIALLILRDFAPEPDETEGSAAPVPATEFTGEILAKFGFFGDDLRLPTADGYKP